MRHDALLPPPLSRALRDAQADAVRDVRQRVDDFLSRLDDDLPAIPPLAPPRDAAPLD